jgi:hypothetical protein
MVGAENELRLMIKGWNVKQLKEFCAERSIKWQFTTPLVPHQNGATEAMVKIIKTALKKAIGDAVLAPFELYTCLLESYIYTSVAKWKSSELYHILMYQTDIAGVNSVLFIPKVI